MAEPLQDSLRLFTCGYATAIATIVVVRLRSDWRFLRAHPQAARPSLLGHFAIPRLSPGQWLATALVLAALLATAAAGVATPIVLALAAVVSGLHFGPLADAALMHRKANTVPVILALLAAGSAPGTTNPDTVSVVIQTVIKLLIAQVYLSAALSKLRASGWRWADGETLRRWLAYYHLRDGSALALRLAGSPRTCRAAATATLAFELTFWVILVFPSLTWAWVAAALVFHLATAALLRIHYWTYLGPAYLLFAAEAYARMP